MNFKEKATLDTTIKFANEEVFYGAFPNYKKTVLKTLNIKHKVIIMEKILEEKKMKIIEYKKDTRKNWIN